jgi:DNA-binding NarL/FixJ family response regulator/Tfp pilus assembly protein PilF
VIGSGALALVQGDTADAASFLEEARELAAQERDQQRLALCLQFLGVMARDQGDYTQAVRLLEESLSYSRALRDTWSAALTINSLAILHQRRGAYHHAAELLQESADIARGRGDPWATAQALSNLAHLAHRQGYFERAERRYTESAELYRQIGDRRGEADAITNLGRIAERQGDAARAIDLHRQSLAIFREIGDRRGTATGLANLCVAHLRAGNLAEAAAAGRESLALRHALHDQEGVATSLEKLAEVATARNRAERAIFLWSAAAATRDAIGAPLAPSERASYGAVVSAARAILNPTRFAAVWTAGRAQSLTEAVEFALGDTDQPVSSGADSPRAERSAAAPAIPLSPREQEVLQLLEEHTDREIADQLSIGPRTASTHVTSIMNKLGVNSRTAAVAFAIRHGLI